MGEERMREGEGKGEEVHAGLSRSRGVGWARVELPG